MVETVIIQSLLLVGQPVQSLLLVGQPEGACNHSNLGTPSSISHTVNPFLIPLLSDLFPDPSTRKITKITVNSCNDDFTNVKIRFHGSISAYVQVRNAWYSAQVTNFNYATLFPTIGSLLTSSGERFLV